MSEVSDMGFRLGVGLEVPAEAKGARVSSKWVSKPNHNGYKYGLVEYGNGVLVEIIPMSSANEARSAVEDGADNQGLGPHLKTVDIQGARGRAHEKLDIEPIWEAPGTPRPGTGIRTGIALVTWARGRFVVKVMHQSLKVEDLLVIAREMKVTPTPGIPDRTSPHR